MIMIKLDSKMWDMMEKSIKICILILNEYIDGSRWVSGGQTWPEEHLPTMCHHGDGIDDTDYHCVKTDDE